MNIFVSSPCPIQSAKYLDNRRVIKMCLESLQLLSTAINYYGGDGPYKSTHENHPCTLWVKESRTNAKWLLTHMKALCNEYTNRYGKHHKCESYLESIASAIEIIPDKGQTPFKNCTDFKHIDDVHQAYMLALNDKWEKDLVKGYTPKWS